ASSILLRAIPGGDGFDFVLRETLGDAVHHGRRNLARFERRHCGDDVGWIAADEPRHRRLCGAGRRVAAGTGEGAGRRIRRPGRRRRPDQREDKGDNSPDACGIHVGPPKGAWAPFASVRFSYALLKSWFLSGSERMRLPVAEKIALHKAGARGGTAVSPIPPQKPPLATITVSTRGISARRSIA